MSSDTAAQGTRVRVAITVAKNSMSVSMILRAPAQDERDITVDEVLEQLAAAGVVFGIDETAISKVVAERQFNAPIKVASGAKPEKGMNASFVYHFDTTADHKPKEDDKGNIDYKDINFIQNVEKGTKLATKVPPTTGKPGKSVLGKEIIGPNGRDLPFKNGVNTAISDDGFSLTATASGAIQFLHGKVSVSDILVIKSDVDHNVGNIECLGSVRVTGTIKAGYKVKIDGDLEVNGNVEDCVLDIKGNIYIKGGFFGKGDGIMQAGGDITLKFAEGQKITAGNDLNVGGEIINCYTIAGNRIHVKGRQGKIIGGEVKARKEIRAAVLGSDAGTTTHLTVGYDQELMSQYSSVTKEIQRLNEDKIRVKEALYALFRLQMDAKLKPEQQVAMEKLQDFQKSLPTNIENLSQQKAALEEKLNEFKDACIIAEDTIYPGVRATFGIVYRDMLEEQQRCKLMVEGNQVLVSEFRGD